MMSLGRKLDGKARNTRQEGATRALIVLTLINLLNFIDRYVPSAVKELIKEDLHLSDAETALPATGMVYFKICNLSMTILGMCFNDMRCDIWLGE